MQWQLDPSHRYRTSTMPDAQTPRKNRPKWLVHPEGVETGTSKHRSMRRQDTRYSSSRNGQKRKGLCKVATRVWLVPRRVPLPLCPCLGEASFQFCSCSVDCIQETVHGANYSGDWPNAAIAVYRNITASKSESASFRSSPSRALGYWLWLLYGRPASKNT